MSTRSRWPCDEDDFEYSDATPYIGNMRNYQHVFRYDESISGIVSFNDENDYCGSLVFSSIVHKVNESAPVSDSYIESKGLFNRFLKFWSE